MVKKIAQNFSLDKDLMKEFNTLIEEKVMNKSKLVEILIQKWIEENRKK